MRKYLSLVLLGVVSLVGLGAAVLGTVQASSGTALGQAVTNTLGSTNYSETLVEKTQQGSETVNLVYQAPDRLGGWLQSGGRRSYLVIIDPIAYQSVTRPASVTRAPLVFYAQQSTGAQNVDPVHHFLPFWNKGPSTRSGSVTTVTLSQGGQTEKLSFTVTGNVVTKFFAVFPGGSYLLDISSFGTSPAVALPKGARVVGAPGATAG